MQAQPLPSSFRDPSGYVFRRDGEIYRKINPVYLETFKQLVASGLCKKLQSEELLVPHQEIPGDPAAEGGGLVIKPQQVPFISYPYEWSFEQLKDAALLTLRIAKTALSFGMVLKDASAYNIQFIGSRAVFIDSLSFDEYQEGSPWMAYGQFCRHFLSPLWLIAHVDCRCGNLLRDFIDGIPLDYTCKLLGFPRRLSLVEWLHLRMHARLQHSKAADQGKSMKGRAMSKNSLLGLLDNLESGIRKLQWRPGKTEWGEYYRHTNYTDTASAHKCGLVEQVVVKHKPNSVWDIGANDGTYSRIAAEHCNQVVAMDIDPLAVNANYKKCKKGKESDLLPLLMDLTNPSPGLGWMGDERDGLFARGPADLVMALALVHHLCISNNVSLERLTSFFTVITGIRLVVEFVPKHDSQVQILLATREDVFPDYDLPSFKAALSRAFDLEEEIPINGSERTLLVFRKQA